MTQTQSELLKLQTTTEDTTDTKQQSNSQIKETEPVENTPFTMITILDQGSFVALGNYRVSDYQTKSDCLDQIHGKEWHLLINVIQSMITMIDKEPNYKQTTTEKHKREVTNNE